MRKNKENKNWTKDKIEPQQVHALKIKVHIFK